LSRAISIAVMANRPQFPRANHSPHAKRQARAQFIKAEKEGTMKILKAALAALPLLASLLLTAGANASTLSSGSGSFTATGEVISVQHADGNTIVTATEVQTLTGVLTGTRVASGTMTFHPDGTFTAHDTGTFTGTIDGRTGSITISGASSGTANTGTGQIVGDRGTGGLAGLHLQGPFQPMITGPTTADGTYSIQFHFDS
jgi:hypothetical protein